MRLTVMKQMAKGLPLKVDEMDEEICVRDPALKSLESIKWYLWHGNVFQALQHIEFLSMDMDDASYGSSDPAVKKMHKTVEEFYTYISRNRDFIPNYGERFRNGETISTSFVESTVNQVISKRMVKKQQMRWTQQGAHNLLQVRTKVLNNEWEQTVRDWYPQFRSKLKEAA